MPAKLIAQGDAGDFDSAVDYGTSFNEGDDGYLEIELRSQLAVDIVSWLDELLEQYGVPEHKLTVQGRILRIHFKVGIWPLPLIIAAILAIPFAIIVLVVAWKLVKIEPEIVAGVSWVTFLLIAGGVLLVLYLIATRGRLAAGPVTVGGK